MKPIISVQNLSKQYRIGTRRASYATLKESLAGALRSPFKRAVALNGGSSGDRVWALKDISFEVMPGEVVGIIGRNGAGKSTLLKMLSRITEPTSGRIELYGRVGSLLEVGTGFHPELTGRENVYLNGAVLGMGRCEIDRKFDEIVAFAEIEKFLDTPVKRYSSGMYMRLAFAVAAHLDPEILIVDEVLAVGDAAFQKKCLGKMEDVRKQGRTVLFVSHQLAAIDKICSRAIMLRSGRVNFDGGTKSALNHYLKDLESNTKDLSLENIPRTGTGDIRLKGFSVEHPTGTNLSAILSGEEVVLVFHYVKTTDKQFENVSIGFSIHTALGEILSIFYSDYTGSVFSFLPAVGKFKCRIKNFPFSIGRYYIGARIIADGVEIDWPSEFIGTIEVTAGDFYGGGGNVHNNIGTVLLKGDWQLEESMGGPNDFDLEKVCQTASE
jgi:lipopolysaccharide transport system ATP-binding protein